MGSGGSKGGGANRMAITAMANVVHFDSAELLAMQDEFRKLAGESSDNDTTINKDQFATALKSVGIQESDCDILNRLFILFDHTGDGQLNYKEFICGVSTILRGEISDRLNFSFKLYDADNSGKISRVELLNILKWMNNTVSFFGDDNLSDQQVTELVEDCFKTSDRDGDGQLDYNEYMDAISKHPNLVAFVGKGDHSKAK